MSLGLLDWRRRVAASYAAVRASADPRAAHERWRAERTQLFGGHPQSPDRAARLRFAGYDPRLRFEVAVASVDPAHLDLATATDGVVPFDRVGRVRLPGVGALDVWWVTVYGGGIWLPLRDPGEDSYPGGRYLLDTVKGADLGGDLDPATGHGTLVVDLNFAYNPSCAYDERWACPLAPAGNVLSVPVVAGELLPG